MGLEIVPFLLEFRHIFNKIFYQEEIKIAYIYLYIFFNYIYKIILIEKQKNNLSRAKRTTAKRIKI